ncbi:MAG: heme o synthase [Acidimicrobiaceae bacterium]|nr:heme o synthase [Acidimicrobiaceae bacterium]
MSTVSLGSADPLGDSYGRAVARGADLLPGPAETAPSETAVPGAATAERGGVSAELSLAGRLAAFVALTKPRIIELLLVTTLPTMFVAARGLPAVGLMVATLVGGTLAAGGANAINMYVDRDIDAVMRRTSRRPLVTGAVTPRAALTFALALEVVAFAELWLAVNLLAACLAVSATLFYVFVYTLWLKRTSKQNVVIGGAAGAVPVLVGWAAVRGSLSLAPFVLFALIFVWTPPHTWALAIRYREDYRSVNVPMLPVVESFRRVSSLILGYSLLVWAVSLGFGWAGRMGPLYWTAAVVLGGMFVGFAVRLCREQTEARAMRLFHGSISYVTLLFVAMAVDQFVR